MSESYIITTRGKQHDPGNKGGSVFGMDSVGKEEQWLVRAAAIVYASYGKQYEQELRRVASLQLRNHLFLIIQLIDRIHEYADVPDRFKNRISTGYDAMVERPLLDIRKVLQVRLLGLCQNAGVTQWLDNKRVSILKKPLSRYDKDMIKRLWP